jgi:hypothetical protein
MTTHAAITRPGSERTLGTHPRTATPRITENGSSGRRRGGEKRAMKGRSQASATSTSLQKRAALLANARVAKLGEARIVRNDSWNQYDDASCAESGCPTRFSASARKSPSSWAASGRTNGTARNRPSWFAGLFPV